MVVERRQCFKVDGEEEGLAVGSDLAMDGGGASPLDDGLLRL